MRNTHLLLNSFFVFLLFCSTLFAQEAPANGRVIINGDNFSQFKALIIPELHDLISNNLLYLDTSKDLAYQTKNLPSFVNFSSQNIINTDDLIFEAVAKGLNKGNTNYSLIFSPDTDKDYGKNLDAKLILWNTYSSAISQKHLRTNFGVHSFSKNMSAALPVISGTIERILSNTPSSDKALPQLFREKISLQEPKVINNYSWLTFRFITNNPEFVWIYSPAINKTRQMNSTNRSDQILSDLPEVDDLFTWSQDPHQVKARFISTVRALAPFPTSSAGRLFKSENNCSGIEDAGMSAPNVSKWNFQTKRFPRAASWSPTRAIFVPRNLIKIQTYSLDPYYTDSVQTLYIDSELMVPVYKISYNSLGKRRKIVFGGFGMAHSADSLRKILYPSFTVSINYEKREAYSIDYNNISICSDTNIQETLKDFEPQKLAAVNLNDSSSAKKFRHAN